MDHAVVLLKIGQIHPIIAIKKLMNQKTGLMQRLLGGGGTVVGGGVVGGGVVG